MKTTIEYLEVSLDVEYSYQPYEAPERGPEAQYPGCGESVELESVYCNGVDIIGLLEEHWEEIELQILKENHNR